MRARVEKVEFLGWNKSSGKSLKFAKGTTKRAEKSSKLRAYILYWVSGYSKQVLDEVKIICYDRKFHIPQTLRRCVLDWYHFYLYHPGGSMLDKTIR